MGEKVVADEGYKDDTYVGKNDVNPSRKEYHSRVRARHDTINKRLKQFNILSNRFRYDMKKYSICVLAGEQLTKLSFELESRHFDI